MRPLVAAALVVGLLLAWAGRTRAQERTDLPVGMSFVARDAAGAWGLYRVNERHAVEHVVTQMEPRQACLTGHGDVGVYAAADGTLRLLQRGVETVMARSDAERSYTQPCLTADGRDAVAVEMAEGKSIETEIMQFPLAPTGKPVPLAPQRGAQLDPFLHQGRWLVYANVHCAAGCDRLIVEIWMRDLLTAEARQLSLLNALSQGPVTDGRRVVFSSNATGSFQLWQVALKGGGQEPLTHGPAQATQAAICSGKVYFVRAGPQGSAVARLEDGGQVVEIPVRGLTSVRALRCLE